MSSEFFLIRTSVLSTRYLGLSSDDLVCSHQDVGWNGQTDLLGGLEIDHQLELRWPLNRQIGGLSSLQDLVHVNSRAPIDVIEIRSVGHQPASIYRFFADM